MNANELADYLLNFIMTVEDYDESKHERAATMLRQQQAEIEVLKKKIQNMALDLLSAHAQADDHWVELERLRKAQEK